MKSTIIDGKAYVDHSPPCGECRAPMQLRGSKHGPFYGCSRFPACRGTHGAHPNGAPLGVPADRPTKDARHRAHAAFDELWRGPKMVMSRTRAYLWLDRAMGMAPSTAHIGAFDIERCNQVVVAVEKFWLEQPPGRPQCPKAKRGRPHVLIAGVCDRCGWRMRAGPMTPEERAGLRAELEQIVTRPPADVADEWDQQIAREKLRLVDEIDRLAEIEVEAIRALDRSSEYMQLAGAENAQAREIADAARAFVAAAPAARADAYLALARLVGAVDVACPVHHLPVHRDVVDCGVKPDVEPNAMVSHIRPHVSCSGCLKDMATNPEWRADFTADQQAILAGDGARSAA